MSNLYFVALSVLLIVVLSAALLYAHVRSRRTADLTWEQLLQRLAAVNRDAIATIALDAINEAGDLRPQGAGFALDSDEIWELLGGLKGLEVLEGNCQVLIELATYVQRWYPEALPIAEQLRLNAREIEWHVGRLKGAAQTGNLQASFADYAQRAVVTYYLMTRHVLALYDHASFPQNAHQIAQLQQAI